MNRSLRPAASTIARSLNCWSPLEEALYWNNRNVIALLLERGAKVQNLRTAAGLGRTDLIESYFNVQVRRLSRNAILRPAELLALPHK